MSPLEEAIGREAWEKYRKALGQLPTAERELIVSRLEYGYSYEEVATLFGKPSPHAARMAVNRALTRLLTLVDA
jgi:RNA polymerase sigma-70 factor (ECF subfamily)